MNRKEAAELLPFILAYIKGKTIQVKNQKDSKGTEEWLDVINPNFDMSPSCYRIKPELKYRPFKDAEECWQEMKNHQPFGWVKAQGQYRAVTRVADGVLQLDKADKILGKILYFDDGLRYLSFADGTPFGIKEGTDD